jgi:ribonuclease P protein component
VSFRYPASVRLKRGWEFDLVFRTGRREKGALVRLLFVAGGEGGARLGVAVGRKVGNAVVRSRGRRVMRESLRRLLPWIRPGVRAVTSLREAGIGANARVVYAELCRLFLRAGLLVDSWPGPDFDADALQPEDSDEEKGTPCPSSPVSCFS